MSSQNALDGKVSAIEAALKDSNTLQYQMWIRHINNQLNEEKVLRELDNKALGRSLIINPLTNEIIIGCNDGNILAINAKTKVTRSILKGHKTPVVALKLLEDNTCLASKGEDGTVLVWSLGDTKARMQLHMPESWSGKEYITNKIIARSHVYRSAIASSFDNDALYRIPFCWLAGLSPANMQQAVYICLLKKLKEYREKDVHSIRTVNVLYNTPIAQLFEHVVEQTSRLFIEQQAKRLGIPLKDTTYITKDIVYTTYE